MLWTVETSIISADIDDILLDPTLTSEILMSCTSVKSCARDCVDMLKEGHEDLVPRRALLNTRLLDSAASPRDAVTFWERDCDDLATLYHCIEVAKAVFVCFPQMWKVLVATHHDRSSRLT